MTGTLPTIPLHYTEQGNGSPLVLLHGFPLNNLIWAETVRTLSDHYRVITPDLRGSGSSPFTDRSMYHMETLAEDVLALLDKLGIEKASIMGHSMGGYVTLALWRLAPERFLSMGLVSTHAWADTDEGRKGREALAEKVFMNGSKEAADAMMPKMFAPETPSDESFIESVRAMMVATNPISVVGMLRGMAARPDSSSLLPDITVPVAVLHGDHDALIPFHRAETMAAAMPDAVLFTIEQAEHMPMLEQPQATAAAIRHFLSKALPDTRT